MPLQYLLKGMNMVVLQGILHLKAYINFKREILSFALYRQPGCLLCCSLPCASVDVSCHLDDGSKTTQMFISLNIVELKLVECDVD